MSNAYELGLQLAHAEKRAFSPEMQQQLLLRALGAETGGPPGEIDILPDKSRPPTSEEDEDQETAPFFDPYSFGYGGGYGGGFGDDFGDDFGGGFGGGGFGGGQPLFRPDEQLLSTVRRFGSRMAAQREQWNLLRDMLRGEGGGGRYASGAQFL
jgi:hypothetical protein